MGAKIRVEMEVSKDFYDSIEIAKYMPDMIMPDGDKQISMTKCVAIGKRGDAREYPTKYSIAIECFADELKSN